MTAGATAAAREPGDHDQQRYRHEALFYAGLEGFLEATTGFVRDGVEAGEAVLVAVGEEKIARLREELRDAADGVVFADMAEVGRNPGRLIPLWRDFVGPQRAAGRSMRGIGEPVWAGRDEAELAECRRHEALLNVALDPTDPLWLVCPYDTETLRDEDLAAAAHTHPHVREAAESRHSETYLLPADAPDPLAERLPAPPPRAEALEFARGRLRPMRRLVASRAAAAGLDQRRRADLVLAVSELAANSIRHGGGSGTLHLWDEDECLWCEISDPGRIDDPLVGRARPNLLDPSGRGLWIVHQVCDLVQVRSGEDGTSVRVRMQRP